MSALKEAARSDDHEIRTGFGAGTIIVSTSMGAAVVAFWFRLTYLGLLENLTLIEVALACWQKSDMGR